MRRHYLIEGRVQGVGFRQFTADAARALKIAGWVKNLADGGVEAEAEADENSLAAFEKLLGKGPGFGRVDSLKKAEVPAGASLPLPFEIRR